MRRVLIWQEDVKLREKVHCWI